MMIAGQEWLTNKDMEQLQLDFSAPASQKLVTQTELNAVTDRYVVENMLTLSTVDRGEQVPVRHAERHFLNT